MRLEREPLVVLEEQAGDELAASGHASLCRCGASRNKAKRVDVVCSARRIVAASA
jgi:hypothetical protein